MISCGARLAPFDIKELRDLTAYDELELDTLGEKKTALFVIISDTDATFNFIVKELLAKLAEYKPLAKIEEIEEQNYNMIDGCVNNNPKKPRIIGNRISVLDRLHIKLEERKQKSQPQQQQQQERSRKN